MGSGLAKGGSADYVISRKSQFKSRDQFLRKNQDYLYNIKQNFASNLLRTLASINLLLFIHNTKCIYILTIRKKCDNLYNEKATKNLKFQYAFFTNIL